MKTSKFDNRVVVTTFHDDSLIFSTSPWRARQRCPETLKLLMGFTLVYHCLNFFSCASRMVFDSFSPQCSTALKCGTVFCVKQSITSRNDSFSFLFLWVVQYIWSDNFKEVSLKRERHFLQEITSFFKKSRGHFESIQWTQLLLTSWASSPGHT